MSTWKTTILRRILTRNESILLLAILVLSIIIGVKSPSFFSPSTLFDLFRISFVQIIFGLGVLIVIVSGGIDVSFPIIGIFAGYATVLIMIKYKLPSQNLLIPLLIALIIGVLLGSVNALFVAGFGIPTLIATLGTVGIFRGSLLSFVGSNYIGNIPEGLDRFATATLFTLNLKDGGLASLHQLIVPVGILCILVSLLLNRTMFGRAVFALGGGIEPSRRLGISIKKTQTRIYLLAGALSGIAGIIFVSLQRAADPFALAGTELNVIAAVVLGGANIFGGYGTVTGTVLGVLLINLIDDNLILLGISGSWERAVIGLLLIIGVTGQAISENIKKKKRRDVLSDGEVIV